MDLRYRVGISKAKLSSFPALGIQVFKETTPCTFLNSACLAGASKQCRSCVECATSKLLGTSACSVNFISTYP